MQRERQYSFRLARPFFTAFGFNAGTQLAELIFALTRLAIVGAIYAGLVYAALAYFAPDVLKTLPK